MAEFTGDTPIAVITQKALSNAKAALRMVTYGGFVPTEKNVRIGYREVSGHSIVSVSFAAPSQVAPTQEAAEAVADRARDSILKHSKKLQSLNDVAPPTEALSVQETEGGFRVTFQMYGSILDLSEAHMPTTSIATERSDRTR